MGLNFLFNDQSVALMTNEVKGKYQMEVEEVSDVEEEEELVDVMVVEMQESVRLIT